MKFPDLSKDEGLSLLDSHLLENSFMAGFEPTQADITVFKALRETNVIKYENITRWYNNIKSFGDDAKSLAASSIEIEIGKPEQAAASVNKKEVHRYCLE